MKQPTRDGAVRLGDLATSCRLPRGSWARSRILKATVGIAGRRSVPASKSEKSFSRISASRGARHSRLLACRFAVDELQGDNLRLAAALAGEDHR